MPGSALLTCMLALGPAASATAREDAPDQARPRRFLVGLEAVGMQVPALDSPLVRLDRRFTGQTVAMGGLGAFGRWRIVPLVGVDLGVRSGSVRYRDDAGTSGGEPESLISHDLLLAEAGVDLFVARGEVGHLGLEAGAGGMFNRVRYELGGDDEPSTQTFGSGLIRAGIGAELLTRRVAFLFSLRLYGVLTDRAAVHNDGPAFRGVDDEAGFAAAPTLQTFVVGSFGVAYRF